MSERPFAFSNLRREQFPVTVEFFSAVTGDLLHTITAEGPGVMEVPGQNFFKQKVQVRISFATGEVWDERSEILKVSEVLDKHAQVEGFYGKDTDTYCKYACFCGWWSESDQEIDHRVHVAQQIAEALGLA